LLGRERFLVRLKKGQQHGVFSKRRRKLERLLNRRYPRFAIDEDEDEDEGEEDLCRREQRKTKKVCRLLVTCYLSSSTGAHLLSPAKPE
jgi:hypothetical protein